MASVYQVVAGNGTQQLVGGHVTRQENAKSPGSGGASPYLPALPRLGRQRHRYRPVERIVLTVQACHSKHYAALF
jgi:hypothetical protein